MNNEWWMMNDDGICFGRDYGNVNYGNVNYAHSMMVTS